MDLGGERRYRRKGSIVKQALHHTVRQIWEKTTCVEVPPYPKDTTAQSQVQGLVAGPILQRYLGWISSGPAVELESNP